MQSSEIKKGAENSSEDENPQTSLINDKAVVAVMKIAHTYDVKRRMREAAKNKVQADSSKSMVMAAKQGGLFIETENNGDILIGSCKTNVRFRVEIPRTTTLEILLQTYEEENKGRGKIKFSNLLSTFVLLILSQVKEISIEPLKAEKMEFVCTFWQMNRLRFKISGNEFFGGSFHQYMDFEVVINRDLFIHSYEFDSMSEGSEDRQLDEAKAPPLKKIKMSTCYEMPFLEESRRKIDGKTFTKEDVLNVLLREIVDIIDAKEAYALYSPRQLVMLGAAMVRNKDALKSAFESYITEDEGRSFRSHEAHLYYLMFDLRAFVSLRETDVRL